jgi:hypothetical protein
LLSLRGCKHHPIVDCFRQVLPRTEVSFRGLNAGVPEQELDLLEVASGGAA